METDINKLMDLCEQELDYRGYSHDYRIRIKSIWNKCWEWMRASSDMLFSAEMGYQYCAESFGSTVLSGVSKEDRFPLRAIRMLITYQRDGDFEFRTPTFLQEFCGDTGKQMEDYLEYLREEIRLSDKTLANKRHYLLAFSSFLENRRLVLDDLDIDTINNFLAAKGYSAASLHNCNSTLKLYLRHAFDFKLTKKDCSAYILPDNYNRQRKLPTTYEEDEIRNLISVVDRASAIGKRDYLVLLLASEYGWRSSDIVGFCFDQIDWDANTISFSQEKTAYSVTFPLLASVGNAVIDYLKNGRPISDADEIIVAHESGKKGKQLATPTIHSIVTKYMKRANISNWQQKKHGGHALRHSLASNMLKRNTSLPMIGTVLGHQSSESTKVYLTIDAVHLKLCALPIPPLGAKMYEVLS